MTNEWAIWQTLSINALRVDVLATSPLLEGLIFFGTDVKGAIHHGSRSKETQADNRARC